MLVPDVDEFTLVLWDEKRYLNNESENTDWNQIAFQLIADFTEQTYMDKLFGDFEETVKGSAGYTNHFTYNDQLFSGLNMAWNEGNKEMGVIISFSASAWLFYRKYFKEQFNKNINISDFLRMAENDSWTSRLSRIDLLVDFKNEGLSVDTIYRSIERGTARVQYSDGRANPSTAETISANGIVETFYLGSRKKNTGLRFRLYDKKNEQISKGRTALRLPEAESLDDWIRLEVVFRNKYAHRLHKDILAVNNQNELKDLIIKAILSKYEFWYVKSEKMMKITRDMKKMVNDTAPYIFENPKTKTVELEKMIKYQMKGSGLFSLLYKLDDVFGVGTSEEFMKWLHEYYMDHYYPSSDDLAWANKFKIIYQMEYSDLEKNKRHDMPWESTD